MDRISQGCWDVEMMLRQPASLIMPLPLMSENCFGTYRFHGSHFLFDVHLLIRGGEEASSSVDAGGDR